jgi:predicted nucleic acid-binding protein
VKTVFVDTSGFYAVLDSTDPFHMDARAAFERAEREKWTLRVTNYVIHETWALTQHRLGWGAVDDFLDVMLPLCQLEFVDAVLHALGAARCRQSRLRHLSLTDCISLEFMKREGITEAIARDGHFTRENILMP